MVVVRAGEFAMESPAGERKQFARAGSLSNASEEQHREKLARPFAVGQFAVTRGKSAAFVENAPAHGGLLVCVSWGDAKEFGAYLSSVIDKSYRLLTEAEREHVSRAGTTTPFWWSSTISTALANYRGDDLWRGKTVPVDAFKAWGL
jgi:formylglycine-generating enzyme required for sulfatase activity